jgi:hypothetical protein
MRNAQYPGGGVETRVGMACNAKNESDGNNLVEFLKVR